MKLSGWLFTTAIILFSNLTWAANPLSTFNLSADQKYLRSLIEDEQTLNDRVENTKEFESITKNILLEPAYRPETQSAFNLPVFLVAASDVVVLQTKPIERDIFFDKFTNRIRFFVHPQSMNAFWPVLHSAIPEVGWQATPISSYRSIMAWNSTDLVYSLKVSLDTEIGAISRMLSRSQIERATVASLAIQQTPKEIYAQQGIYFIDEPVSVYFKKFQFSYMIRENPKLKKGSKLVPLFSLYAKRGNNGSLLQKLIDHSELSAKEFVAENIIKLLVNQALYLGLQDGLIGAPHEQNVLVEMTNGKLTKNFHYRDLGSFHINENLRQLAGKRVDFIPLNFLPENLKGSKNSLIQSLQDYLVPSQFFAMVRSLRPGQMSDVWVEKTVLNIISERIKTETGIDAKTWQGVKGAVSRHIFAAKCEALF